MVNTKAKDEARIDGVPRRRGPTIAAATFAAIAVAVVAIAVILNAGDDSPPTATTVAETQPTATTIADPEPVLDPSLGAAIVVGGRWNVPGDQPGSAPDTIEFDSDGTYRVTDSLGLVDTGVYTTDGETITFESDPTDEVQWVRNDAFLRSTDPCEGVVGEYRVAFEEPGRIILRVISDGCPPRVSVANRLQLEPAAP